MKVVAKAHALPNGRVKFCTQHGFIPAVIARITCKRMLKFEYRRYCDLIRSMGYEVKEIENVLPLVFQEMMSLLNPLKKLPIRIAPLVVTQPKVIEEEFEVNMMEALVGWKCWRFNQLSHAGKLITQGVTYWYSDTPVEAVCKSGCRNAPDLHHTCGIYAADKSEVAFGYYAGKDQVQGQIYGWGRYVRHEGGWRAQFAYPKSFHLKDSQVELIESLKAYHVPIYISQPTLIYDPEDDGYANWRAEENWNSRTDSESDASED
jgi:hypothetical protein